MGLLNLFQRKSAGDFERRGDLCASSGALGAAKIEYEAALDKLPREDLSARNRIEVKIRKTLTALAAAHKQTGDDLLGGDTTGKRSIITAWPLNWPRNRN